MVPRPGRPLLFKSQAQKFLENSMRRRRNPAKPATIRNWQSCLARWLNPEIGDQPLADVNNAILKQLVAKMCDAGLSAQTVVTYTGLVKLVVGSALDENGEELFPRKWNHDFIDLPIIANQHRPTFSAETMSSIAQADTRYRPLFALLGKRIACRGSTRVGDQAPFPGLPDADHFSERLARDDPNPENSERFPSGGPLFRTRGDASGVRRDQGGGVDIPNSQRQRSTPNEHPLSGIASTFGHVEGAPKRVS